MRMITKAFIKERTESFNINKNGMKVKLFTFKFGNINISHCERVAECDYFDEYHQWDDVYIQLVSYYDYVYQNGKNIGYAKNLKEFIDVVQKYYKANVELWKRQWESKVLADKWDNVPKYTSNGEKIVSTYNIINNKFIIRVYSNPYSVADRKYKTISYNSIQIEIMRWWSADEWKEYLSKCGDEYNSF